MVQLIELLGNKNLMKILSFFLRNPTIQIHQKKLQKETKLAKTTLIKWLKILIKHEILKIKKFGATTIYSLNKEDNTIKIIKLLDTLFSLKELQNIKKKYNIKIYLYGSCARGEDVEESDIDLLIIGKIKKEDIIGDINKISDKLKRKIKLEIFSFLEWSKIAKEDKAFYERVEKDKIEV